MKRLLDLTFGFFSLMFIYPFVYVFTKQVNHQPDYDKFHKKILLIPKVLKGELSLVGRATWDLTARGNEHLGKKGLTGLVQINYDKRLSEDEVEYYNYYYAKNQSLIFDLEIILKTISLYLFRKKIVNA